MQVVEGTAPEIRDGKRSACGIDGGNDRTRDVCIYGRREPTDGLSTADILYPMCVYRALAVRTLHELRNIFGQ